MPRNVGGIERGIRIVVGVVLFGLALFHVLTGAMGLVAYIVGGIALLTGLTAYRPAWSIFGINTSAAKEAKAGVKH